MAQGKSDRVRRVIRLWRRRQRKYALDHVHHLGFLCSPIPYDRLFYLKGRIFVHLDSRLLAGQ